MKTEEEDEEGEEGASLRGMGVAGVKAVEASSIAMANPTRRMRKPPGGKEKEISAFEAHCALHILSQSL